MPTFVEKILATHEELERHGVRHAFGGAIALGYHVESPRATSDIDVNITAPTDQAASVLAALPRDVAWTSADTAQIQRDGQVRVFWDTTPVDLFFPQDALHDLVAERVEAVPFADTTIPVLSATDLTIFKALFDRTKDWADIEEMLAYGEVDVDDVRSWLVRLLGADDPRVGRFDRSST